MCNYSFIEEEEEEEEENKHRKSLKFQCLPVFLRKIFSQKLVNKKMLHFATKHESLMKFPIHGEMRYFPKMGK